MPIIQTAGLRKEYRLGLLGNRTITALDGVSVAAYEGEIFALLGLNGAGKSTLTKILLDHVRPISGSAKLFGHSVSGKDWKGRVGYLPEVFRVPLAESAVSLLKYLGNLSGMGTSMLRERIEETLATVGLSDARHQHIRTYSKGMMVRLGIAQAILHRPALLMLDEPTEGLDPAGKILVRNLLQSLAADGTTVFMNSHLLSEVETIAHRVGMLHKGKLVLQGSLKDVLPNDERFEVETAVRPTMTDAWSFRQAEVAWMCDVSGSERLQTLLLELKKQNIAPLAIRPRNRTLEEVFFKYINEEGR